MTYGYKVRELEGAQQSGALLPNGLPSLVQPTITGENLTWLRTTVCKVAGYLRSQ